MDVDVRALWPAETKNGYRLFLLAAIAEAVEAICEWSRTSHCREVRKNKGDCRWRVREVWEHAIRADMWIRGIWPAQRISFHEACEWLDLDTRTLRMGIYRRFSEEQIAALREVVDSYVAWAATH